MKMHGVATRDLQKQEREKIDSYYKKRGKFNNRRMMIFVEILNNVLNGIELRSFFSSFNEIVFNDNDAESYLGVQT